MTDDESIIEKWAREEYRDGVSSGAAARQLCRLLGMSNASPTLKRILEDMLGDINRASHDRHMILVAFDEASPNAAKKARRESFKRLNGERK